METPPIIHDLDRHCFLIRFGEEEAELIYRPVGSEALNLIHTQVPVSQQGKGVSKRLILAAFAYATAHKLRLIPTCPFVARYLRRHPEYVYLVEGRFEDEA